jgi:hypothetical protein
MIWWGKTYVWRVLKKEVGRCILKPLEILVDLALVFQKHGCGRLERMSIGRGSRLSVDANLGRRLVVVVEPKLPRDKSTGVRR